MKINLKKALAWIGRRLKERSTYVGAATIAGALGAEAIGIRIDQAGLIVPMILGGGLMAASSGTGAPA